MAFSWDDRTVMASDIWGRSPASHAPPGCHCRHHPPDPLHPLGPAARIVFVQLALYVPHVETRDVKLNPAFGRVQILHHDLIFGHRLPTAVAGLPLPGPPHKRGM
jgi:hypothetical protein